MNQKILIYQLLHLHHTPSIQLSLVKMALALSSDEIDEAAGFDEDSLYSKISLLDLKKYDTMFDAVVPEAINPLTIVVNDILNSDITAGISQVNWDAEDLQKAVVLRLLSIMAVYDGLIDNDESLYIKALSNRLSISQDIMLKTHKLSKSQLLAKLTLKTINEFQPDFIRLALLDKDLDRGEMGILKEISLLKRSLKSIKVFWP